MEHSLSHTFQFKTSDILEPSSKLNNIITISEYAARKHYIQYLQCHKRETIDNKSIIYYRQFDMKVDRKYYLEIANIAIDDLTRSRYFFSILGRRCFGATYNKDEFFLLDYSVDTQALYTYIHTNKKTITPILLEKNDTNFNRYTAYIFEFGVKNYAALFQENISQRNKLLKNYYVEISDEELYSFMHIKSQELKIEFLFSIIGKIYFNSFALERLETTEQDLEAELKKLTFKAPLELEYTSRVHENRIYNELKGDAKEIESACFNLYHRSLAFLHNAKEFESLKLFSISIVQFVSHLRQVKELEDVVSYFTAIHLFADDGKLGYLLEKKDKDFVDIFLYMLECLSEWNTQLNTTKHDLKSFNIATIDLQAAMKYLFETYLKFSHQYNCNDAAKEVQGQKEQKKPLSKLKMQFSAQEFCQNNPIGSATLDELRELENDVAILFQEKRYEEFLKDSLHKFLTGYTSILNEYLELRNLAYSLTLVMSSIENAGKDVEDEELLLVLLQSLVTSLTDWSKAVFIEQNAHDIRFMDEVFYEYIAQIEIVLGSMDESLSQFSD